MRSTQIYNEYLYEGLNKSSRKTMRLWEGAAIQLKEAALTPDQIQQIFTSVEQGATASGANRTLIGKGKDAAVAVNKAWEDLKTKVQDSAPIKNVDSAYDSAVSKIEAGLGGPDNAVNQVIQKYRAFAKANPIAQSLIYAILIAAAGISGVGLGGAAVLGLLKMTDKLLQGEKFSTAVGKGLATGATAYAAGQIGQAFKGKPEGEIPVAGARGDVGAYDQAAGPVYRGASGADPGAVIQGAANQSLSPAANQLANAIDAGKPITQSSINALQSQLDKLGSMGVNAMSNPDGTASALGMQYSAYQDLLNKAISAGAVKESIALSENQIATLFTLIQIKNRQFNEGMWDNIKNKAATVGKNLTTKVTADKLNSAWKKAGSPTDSEQVSQVIQGAGVDPAVVSKAYTDMGIAAPAAKTDPAADAAAPAADPTKPDELNDIKKNAGLPVVNIKDMLAQITALTPAEQQQVLAYLKK